jgi:hypothetical protein
MKSKLSVTGQYFSWIYNKIHEINAHKQQQEAYRLVDIMQDKSANYVLRIQVTGKSSFFTCSPREVMVNDHLMEGFSKKDIRTIAHYAAQTEKKPKYRIVIQEFCEKLNRMIFRLIGQGLSDQIEKTAQEISLDNQLIQQLNPEDAHLVGYTTASEHFIKEKEEMEQLKQELDK